MTSVDEPAAGGLRGRAAVLAILLFLAAAGIIGRLWQLQIRRGDTLYTQALNQSMHVVSIPAPRGQILDRNGRVLATDVPVFEAALTWTAQPPTRSELDLLTRILGVSAKSVDSAEHQVRSGNPLTPVVLRTGLTPMQQTLLVEDRPELPGVEIVNRPIRRYPGIPGNADPGQELAANLLGFVKDGRYPGDMTGADGIELSFNGPLTGSGGQKVLGLEGVDGEDYVIENRAGHPVREVALRAPVPGNDVVLTIDAKLQAVLQRAITSQTQFLRTQSLSGDGGPYPQAYAAAGVVINVNNGQILAAASEPTFNPNAFAEDVSAVPGGAEQQAFAAQYQAWLNAPGAPLIDHVVSDTAPPGSTFKPITAIAALEDGVITPQTRLQCVPDIPLAGGFMLKNWIYPQYGGDLNLTEAIARSCDTFFYQVGAATGIAAIDRVATEFGLGQLTGQTALYGEDPGQISSPAAEPKWEGPWTTALTMQSAIGQGFAAFNPLEYADYVAALANGGTLWRPYFVSQVRSPSGKVLITYHPKVRRHIAVSPAILAAVRHGMEGVTEQNPAWLQNGIDADFGTAFWIYYGFPQETQQYLGQAITVAGKTGTAQIQPGQTPDGWWISYAPAQHPQIAVVIFVHHANEGFGSGAPIAREVYDYYFGLDKAMWKAGQASQIVSPVIQQFFGETQQYPDWWPATPPPPKSVTPNPSTAAAATSATTASAATASPSRNPAVRTTPSGSASGTGVPAVSVSSVTSTAPRVPSATVPSDSRPATTAGSTYATAGRAGG